MFAKFATAKNRKKLNPLKVSSNRCYLPENNIEDVKHYECSPTGIRTTNPPNYSPTLYVSYRATCSCAKEILRLFANHLFREYRERTTLSWIFVPRNLNSWRVYIWTERHCSVSALVQSWVACTMNYGGMDRESKHLSRLSKRSRTPCVNVNSLWCCMGLSEDEDKIRSCAHNWYVWITSICWHTQCQNIIKIWDKWLWCDHSGLSRDLQDLLFPLKILYYGDLK